MTESGFCEVNVCIYLRSLLSKEHYLLKRKSQFTALIDIDGAELIAHIPTTNRIGDVENKNLPCLLSYHDDPKRKLKYDIEAVLLSDDENWIGIHHNIHSVGGRQSLP